MGQKILVVALFTSDSGETVRKDAAANIFLEGLFNLRAKASIFFLKAIRVDLQELIYIL